MAGLAILANAYIDNLNFSAVMDISGVTGLPFIVLTNESTGGGLDANTFWYEWITPSGNVLHQGDYNNPDIPAGNSGLVFNTNTLGIIWPQPQNHIEWGIYTIIMSVRTPVDDTVYSYKRTFNICAPHGNNGTVGNNHGVAKLGIKVLCKDNIITATDNTLYVYQSATGAYTVDNPKWRLQYPPILDDTLSQPAPVLTEGVPATLFSALVNGENHVLLFTSVVTYSISTDYQLIVKYKVSETFDVYCNLNLEPLLCSYQEFLKNFASCCKTDNNYAINSAKYQLLSGKILLLLMSVTNTAACCDVNINDLVEEIKNIGGFDCCCYGTTGTGNTINPNAFEIVPCFEALNIDTTQPINTMPGLLEALQKAACDAANNVGGNVSGTPRVVPMFHHDTGIGLQNSQLVQYNIGDPGLIDMAARQLSISGSMYLNGDPKIRFAKYGTHQSNNVGIHDPILEHRGPGGVYAAIALELLAGNLFAAQYEFNQYVKEIRFLSSMVPNGGLGAPFIFNNRIQTANPNGANTAGLWMLGKGSIGPLVAAYTHKVKFNIDGVNYVINAVIE